MLRVYRPIRPTSGACVTTDTTQDEKRLFKGQNQAILTSDGKPLGECRLNRVRFSCNLTFMQIKLKQVLGLDPKKILGSAENSLDFAEFVSSYHYREIWLRPSRMGKKSRRIALPSQDLLRIQRRINAALLLSIRPHKAATAYYPGSSIIINAARHLRCRYLYKTDISNFFSSIDKELLEASLREQPFHKNPTMVDELLPLVCKDGSLPVGAATSAHLSNIVLKNFDRMLFEYAAKRGAVFTRYGDDIAVSSTQSFDFDEMDSFVQSAFTKYCFEQNRRKTRFLGKDSPKTITGISITDGYLRPTRRFRKSCAASVRVCEKYPSRYTISNAARIDGFLNFWRSVCPSDPTFRSIEERVRRLTIVADRDARENAVPF